MKIFSVNIQLFYNPSSKYINEKTSFFDLGNIAQIHTKFTWPSSAISNLNIQTTWGKWEEKTERKQFLQLNVENNLLQ